MGRQPKGLQHGLVAGRSFIRWSVNRRCQIWRTATDHFPLVHAGCTCSAPQPIDQLIGLRPMCFGRRWYSVCGRKGECAERGAYQAGDMFGGRSIQDVVQPRRAQTHAPGLSASLQLLPGTQSAVTGQVWRVASLSRPRRC